MDLQEYYLQAAKGGKWQHIIKSYEKESLIEAARLRSSRRRGKEICRVIDQDGNVLWHAGSAHKDASNQTT